MDKFLKIVQLNKGDAKLYNRTDQINQIINEHKPHIFILNELNSETDDSISRQSFPNYKLEVYNLEVVDQRARTGILIHEKIHYNRRCDLETQGTLTVWIQLSYPGCKPVLIQAIYRQFQRLGVIDSDSIKSQKTRWDKVLEKWERAITEELEIITLGDLNLNMLRWETPISQKTSYERAQTPMVEALVDRILQKGFKIFNSQPTRTKDNHESKPACLDLIITNRTEKVINYQSGLSSFSDHTLQIVNR